MSGSSWKASDFKKDKGSELATDKGSKFVTRFEHPGPISVDNPSTWAET